MTGLVAAVVGGRAVMVTDAAAYDPKTGAVIGFTPKMFEVPRTSAVFSGRGPVSVWTHFHASCAAAKLRSFDDFLARSPKIFADLERRLGSNDSVPSEVVVAGWSAARRAMILCVRPNHDRHGTPPGALVSCASFCSLPSETVDPKTFTVERGVKILQAQRDTPLSDLTGGPELITVGGWIDAVEIRPGGRPTFRRVHEWPEDEVGKPLVSRSVGQTMAVA